jgi:hypothetical protein
MRKYSTHATRRMEEREITEADIESALRRSTGPPAPGDNGCIVVFGYASGQRILKVVLTADQRTVVSVMEVDG